MDREKLTTAVRGGVISLVEVFSQGAVSALVVSFASLYSTNEYAAFLPWIGCQQLILVLAPFGMDRAVSILIVQSGREAAQGFSSYIPRYVATNLVMGAPLSWLLTWLAIRQGLTTPSTALVALIVLTSAGLTIQRTQQSVILLTGETAQFTKRRIVYGLLHVCLGITLALSHASIMIAYFLSQLCALGVVQVMSAQYGRKRVSTHPRPEYWCVFQRCWVFGIWSIFGWFSGYGATLLFAKVNNPTELARYGQTIGFVGLVGMVLGGATTAIHANLVKRRMQWSQRIETKFNALYNWSIVLAAGFAALATVLRLEQTTILHRVLPLWPGYIWIYFFVAYASQTFYQRVMLRHQYDPTVRLSWMTVAAGEIAGILAFAAVLNIYPARPLFASGALLTARHVALFLLAAPRGPSAWFAKVATVSASVALGVLLHLLWKTAGNG